MRIEFSELHNVSEISGHQSSCKACFYISPPGMFCKKLLSWLQFFYCMKSLFEIFEHVILVAELDLTFGNWRTHFYLLFIVQVLDYVSYPNFGIAMPNQCTLGAWNVKSSWNIKLVLSPTHKNNREQMSRFSD